MRRQSIVAATPLRVLAAGLIAGLLLLAGCSGDAESDPGPTSEGPRPLTSEESERLAVARFRNFDDGVRSVAFSVTDSGATYAVDGWLDFVSGLGYGAISGEESTETLLLAWTHSALTSRPWQVGEPAPLPPPDPSGSDQDWTSSELSPEESRLHALLAIVVSMGSDRPDNALLLSQTDARWLRTDEVDGVAVDVITGPTADVPYDPETSTAAGDGSDATLRYWVDADGLIHRLEVRLGGAGEWTAVEFGPADDIEFADTFLDVGGTP